MLLKIFHIIIMNIIIIMMMIQIMIMMMMILIMILMIMILIMIIMMMILIMILMMMKPISATARIMLCLTRSTHRWRSPVIDIIILPSWLGSHYP